MKKLLWPAGRPCQGFSLLEMALSLAILASLLAPLGHIMHSQQQARKVQLHTREYQQVENALHAFVMAHGRLPCPAKTDAMKEERVNERCEHATGPLPLSTLGLAPKLQHEWMFVVATLENAGAPAAHRFFKDQVFDGLTVQALTQIVFQPITASNSLNDSALPAIHLCLRDLTLDLPTLETRGCDGHTLQTPGLVAVAYPVTPATDTNHDRTNQFLIHPHSAERQLIWLSYEQFIGSRTAAGWQP